MPAPAVTGQIGGDRRAGRVGQRLGRNVVQSFHGAHLVGHEVVEPHIQRALLGNGVAIADALVEKPFESIHPRRGDLLDVDGVGVHARRVGDHRDHRQRHRHGIAVGECDHGPRHDSLDDRQLAEMLGRLEYPPTSAAEELQRLELYDQVFVGRGLVVAPVVLGPSGNMGQRFHQHRREIVGQQLNFLVRMLGRHLMHQREIRHQCVHRLHCDVHPRDPRIRIQVCFGL